MIGIGNGRQGAGGGQQLCPEALINDGQLQLRIFTGELRLLPALLHTLTQPEESPEYYSDGNPWFEVNAPHG